MAPFKLPQEYIDILGGLDSERFQDFRTLTKQCFWSVRKHAESIIMIVELMQKGQQREASTLSTCIMGERGLTSKCSPSCRLCSALLLFWGSDGSAAAAALPAFAVSAAVRRICGPPDRLIRRLGLHAPLRRLPDVQSRHIIKPEPLSLSMSLYFCNNSSSISNPPPPCNLSRSDRIGVL